MAVAEIERQRARLRSVIARAGHAAALRDIEVQAHWARYCCVLVAGFLEESIRHLFGTYAKKNSHHRVNRYVGTQLKWTQNPKTQVLLDLAGCFDPAWQTNLTKFVDSNGRRDAIDSIMSNRHLIAHGRDSAITIARVDLYFKKIIEVVEKVEEEIGI